MINMINYFLCALGVWMLMGALHTVRDETRHRWLETCCDYAISLPWVILAWTAVIIVYPIAFVWKFFYNAFKGVSVECWKKAKITHFWKLGCLRFCYDPEARKLLNKFFLVRIVKPSEEIKHSAEKK